MNTWTCSVRDYENKSSAALRCDTDVIQCVSDQAWDQVGWILAEFFFCFFDDPSHSRGPIKSVKRKKKFFSLKRSYRFRLLHWVALKGEKKNYQFVYLLQRFSILQWLAFARRCTLKQPEEFFMSDIGFHCFWTERSVHYEIINFLKVRCFF